MFKKVLTLMLVLVGVLALAGCKPVEDDPDPELTTLEKISEAMDQLDLPGTASSDLTLLTSGLHDVVITWESSNEDVIATDGTVTIPLNTEGDETVTITAYLALDGETLTKTFEVEVLAATEMTDAEKAHIAAIAFNGLVSGNIIADVTLPTTGQYSSTVVWVSSHPDYVTDAGVITRPDEATGNVVVTLTGTVTVGTASEDVVLSFTVVAEEGATVYTDIAAMHAAAIIDDYIEFTGIVTGVFDGGYFLSDGTNALGIYAGNNDLGAAIGDEVKVKGFYAVYNTLYQLGNVVSEEILSSGNANPLDGTATVVTVAELLAVDSSDALIHGQYYTVTGTIELRGSYNNVYLVEGDDAVLIYYYSLEDSLAALEAEVGKEVTITVFYYTDHGTNGPMVAFDGLAADITVNALPDADALAADIAALEGIIPAATVSGVTLPTEGPNGTMFTAWASDNTAVLGNDGAFVALGATTVTVTFTATATKGTETATATVEVVVPVLSTVAEVNMMDIGSVYQVSGIVYEISYYGFFIEEAGYYLFVFGSDYVGDVAVGDAITLLASSGEYSGLLQASPIGEITVDSQGNADPVTAIAGTVEGIAQDLYPRGSRVTITAEVKLEGNYDDVMLYGVTGDAIKVYYRSNADEIAYVDESDVSQGLFDQIVTLTVVLYQDGTVLFQGMTADITTGAAFDDDAANAQAIADGIDLGIVSAVESNLTLPTTNADPVATIAWASDNEAVIATDGTVTRVAGSDTVVTLTATVTVGVETATRTIECTVVDANDSQPMTVTDALLETDGANLLVTGVVTGTYLTYGDNEVVIQDPVTGDAIYVDFDVTGAVVGDIVVVRGDLESYTSYGNNKRQLDSGSLISIESSGNAVTVDAETDVAVIAEAFAEMKTYTTTLTVDSFDTFGYVFFDGSWDGTAGKLLKFDTAVYAPWFEDIYSVDDTVVATFTVMDINFDNTRIVNVQLPALTDAQAVAAAKAALDIPASTATDLTLPTELYGVAISWASSNPAIGVDGVVTQPASGAGEATGDLTATLTLNAETDTAVFTVVVPEEVAAAPLFFSEYAEADGGNCKYGEIYNPTGAAVDLTGYRVVQGNNGGMFADSTRITELSGTLAAGGVLVIGNTGCTDPTDPAQDAALANPFPTTGIDFIEGTSIGYTNGDDAMGLFFYDELLDVIGEEGVDPGSSWAVGDGDLLGGTTANVIMVRVATVSSGETDWAVGAMQWVVSTDNRDYSTVGVHTHTPAT